MSATRQLFRASAAVTALTLVSRVLGLLRELLIAARFGASGVTDTYLVAISIPNVMSTLLVPIGSALVAVLAARKTEPECGDDSFGPATLWRTAAGLTVVTAIGLAWPRSLLTVVAPGLAPETIPLALASIRIQLPGLICLGIVTLVQSIHNARGKVLWPALVPVIGNTVMVAGLALPGMANLHFLDALTVGAFGVQAVVAVWSLSRNASPVFAWGDRHDPRWSQLVSIALPLLASSFLGQVSGLFERALASGLDPGRISALTFADRLRQLPLGLASMVIMSVWYPHLAALKHQDMEAFHRRLRELFVAVLSLLLPVSVGVLLFSAPLTRLSFERGAFDQTATALTSLALACYAPSLVAMGLNSYLIACLYTLHRTREVALWTVAGTVLSLGGAWVGRSLFGLGGIAGAGSISALCLSGCWIYALRRELFDAGHGMWLSVGKVVAANAAVAVVVWLIMH